MKNKRYPSVYPSVVHAKGGGGIVIVLLVILLLLDSRVLGEDVRGAMVDEETDRSK
jgi:hypothetical protein